jgi:hypothetical protein
MGKGSTCNDRGPGLGAFVMGRRIECHSHKTHASFTFSRSILSPTHNAPSIPIHTSHFYTTRPTMSEKPTTDKVRHYPAF